MNRERLQAAADFCRTIPPAKFRMAEWPRCLVGHMARSGKFEGLALAQCSPDGPLMPRYGHAWAWNAVRSYFDVPHEDAWELFAGEDRTPASVADRIEEYLCSPPSSSPCYLVPSTPCESSPSACSGSPCLQNTPAASCTQASAPRPEYASTEF